MSEDDRFLHAEIKKVICEGVNEKVGDFNSFKQKLRNVLKPAEIEGSTFKILEKLDNHGRFGLGNYSLIKQALGEEHKSIVSEIEKLEEQMKGQFNPDHHVASSMVDPNMELHNNLLAEIPKYLTEDDMNNLREIKLDHILKPLKRTKDKSFREIAAALESLGHLYVNNYTLLKKLFDDKTEILKLIEETENKMKQNPPNLTLVSPVEMDNDDTKRPARTRKQLTSTINEEQIEAKLRRTEDVSLSYEEIENLMHSKLRERVGNIQVREMQGTGFRVGKCYVMSAYHTFEDYLGSKWNDLAEIIHKGLENERNILKALEFILQLPGQTDVPETVKSSTGKDQVLKYITCWKSSHQPNKCFKDLVEPIKNVQNLRRTAEEIEKAVENLKDVEITFSDYKEKENGKVYHLDLKSVVFYNEQHDVIILRIVETEDLPERLALQRTLQTHMHLLGHPGGKKLKLDPGCEVYLYDENGKATLQTHLQRAKEWCRGQKNDAYDRLYQNYDEKNRVIFHCSSSTAHGASGSPGLVQDLEKPGYFKVQTMLSRGTPGSGYSGGKLPPAPVIQPSFPPHCLFESGISMEKLYAIMDSVEEIRSDIFQPLE